MLSIWFMYDRHVFARIKERDKDGMMIRVTELFAEDGCGSIYVRDGQDAEIKGLTLDGRRLEDGKWGIPPGEIEAWADKVIAEASFRTLMV